MRRNTGFTVLLASALLASAGCSSSPPSKESVVGVWTSDAGATLEFREDDTVVATDFPFGVPGSTCYDGSEERSDFTGEYTVTDDFIYLGAFGEQLFFEFWPFQSADLVVWLCGPDAPDHEVFVKQ